jgi:hypothetical protein
MSSQIIGLACGLVVAACGSSSVQPAQEPTSGMTTTAESHPVVATANTAVDTRDKGDNKATGASTYVSANHVTPTIGTQPGIAEGTKNADNTKTNTRESHKSLTPMDQGNSAAETKITADIHKGIMGDRNVSFSCKNVKVITVGTKVTLRRPVKNDKERNLVEENREKHDGREQRR